jgi:hypothetical protein
VRRGASELMSCGGTVLLDVSMTCGAERFFKDSLLTLLTTNLSGSILWVCGKRDRTPSNGRNHVQGLQDVEGSKASQEGRSVMLPTRAHRAEHRLLRRAQATRAQWLFHLIERHNLGAAAYGSTCGKGTRAAERLHDTAHRARIS